MLTWLTVLIVGFVASPASTDELVYEHPQRISECLAGRPDLQPSFAVNPYYLRGDFDGDGSLDYAVLVTHVESRDTGILICLKGRDAEIIGLSNPVGPGPWRDLGFFDMWMIYERRDVQRGATEADPPVLNGEGILIIKEESASALLYRDTQRWHWYQQGD